MDEQEQNSISNEKTPQEELEELLQKSKSTKATTGIKIPGSGKIRGKINFLGVGIVVLVLVLIVGTVYLILKSFTFNSLDVTFGINESSVILIIDGENQGKIDSGYTKKMKLGEHKILLTKEGFLDLEEDVIFESAEEMILNFELLPIPEIERVLESQVSYVRLDNSGSEISYYDSSSSVFKSINLENDEVVELFNSNISNVVDVQWSPVIQSAIVKLQGRKRFTNIRDNRLEDGRYIPQGERPIQAPSNFNGVGTWLFNDTLRESSGWLPVLITDNAREVAFSYDGSAIIYLHEPADGEYSIVKAWPDGLEWERVVTVVPRFNNPKLIWGADDRYLLINDEPTLYVIDLISREVIDSIFVDRIANSHFEISANGERIAYVATVDGKPVVRVYDLIGESYQTLNSLTINANSIFVFMDGNNLLLSMPNGVFKKIDIEEDIRSTIPSKGDIPSSTIRYMKYSRVAKLLLLVTDDGVFKMRI